MPNQPQPCSSESGEMNQNGSLAAAIHVILSHSGETELRRYLNLNWPLGELTNLLYGDRSDSARAAAYCLGILGGEACVLPLVGALSHDGPAIASAAEDALWRLWFGAAGSGARRRLSGAVDLMTEARYEAAIATLDGVVEQTPRFAEAYHQRGLARQLNGDAMGSVADFKRSLELNPCHFGALAGLGRSYADMGSYASAIASFRHALQIHPRLDGVRQAMRLIHDADGVAAPLLQDE